MIELSNEQAHERLMSEDNLANMFGAGAITTEVFVKPKHLPKFVDFRTRTRLTEEQKTEIGTRGALGEPARELAAEFNTTFQTATNLRNNANTEIVGSILDKIRDSALDRLLKGFNHLTEEKMEKASARDVAGVLKSLAEVSEKLQPKENNSGPQLQVILHAVPIKKEEKYQVVEI